MKTLVAVICVFMLFSCSESIEPEKVPGKAKKPYEKSAVDTVGVAKGDKQISPNGRPSY